MRVDHKVCREQVVAAMAAGENQRKPKRGEVQRRLAAIKTIADEFVAQKNYAAALTIYEVLGVLRTLFAIYRFYTASEMDLDEDIPGLLLGNTTLEERQVIAGWVQDALDNKAAWSNGEKYKVLLAALERTNKR